MSTVSNSAPQTSEEISFVQFNEPALKSGEYQITLDQTISIDNKVVSNNGGNTSYSVSKNFFVAGDRFSIKPQEIYCQFPPPFNDGDHSNVMPHIVLTRSTLPWERAADPDDSELPWLWLFVYSDDDLNAGNVIAPQQMAVDTQVCFLNATTGEPLSGQTNPQGIRLDAEPQENLQEQVKVLQVNAQWLQSNDIVPSSDALKLLTSVRKNTSASDVTEWALCVANRLPLAGGNSYAHLVSLENRFSNDSFDFDAGKDDKGNISFISLASWKFSCPNDISYQVSTTAVSRLQSAGIEAAIINEIQTLPADALYHSTSAFLPVLEGVISSANHAAFTASQTQILQCLQAPTATFKGLLEQVNRDNFQQALLPNTSAALTAANQYIQRGAIALPHQLRQGGETVSWYHGPFVGGSDPDSINAGDFPVNLPTTASDQLLRFDSQLGMFDVSYAAAWELGRLLMLNNRTLAMKLFAWKRQNAWDLKAKEQGLLYDHLPFASAPAVGSESGDSGNTDTDDSDNTDTDTSTQSTGTSQTLYNWFNELNLLHYVPFNYLVPDESLLPNESIRFFTLDNLWVECLMDGAFSIARVTEGDCQNDSKADLPSAQYPVISGFLLRSEVVSGWPALQVNASSDSLSESQMPDSTSPLTLLRMDTLAPDLLICLFDGQMKTVDIHLKAESLHFGFDRPFGEQTSFYKELKNLDTGAITSPLKTVDISWLNQDSRVVDINTLNSAIYTQLDQSASAFSSAQFALEMIEGVPRIRFLMGS